MIETQRGYRGRKETDVPLSPCDIFARQHCAADSIHDFDRSLPKRRWQIVHDHWSSPWPRHAIEHEQDCFFLT